MTSMQITIDVKLRLLAGMPIHVDTFGLIKPLTVREIIEYGYEKYIAKLNIIALNKEQIVNKDISDEFNEFDILFLLGDESVNNLLKQSLEFFFKEEVHLVKDQQVIVVGSEQENFKLINRKSYMDIRKILLMQNGILSVDDEMNLKSKDEKAKAIAERMKKAQEEVKRIKSKDGESNDTDFFDLLSSISSKSSSMNKLNIFDLTMFQVYEEFKRLNLIDQYHTNIKALLAGAKSVKLKHWSSKIKI
jgi:hypothetical protein